MYAFVTDEHDLLRKLFVTELRWAKAFYLVTQTLPAKITGGLPNSRYKVPCDKSNPIPNIGRKMISPTPMLSAS